MADSDPRNHAEFGFQADVSDTEKRQLKRDESNSSLNSLLAFPSAVSDTTHRAWERVQERYKRNPNPKWVDIIRGLSFLNPLASSTVTSALSFGIFSVLIFHAYVNIEQFRSTVENLQASVVANIVELTVFAGAILLIQLAYTLNRSRPVYIVDFATFKPPAKNVITHEKFMELTRDSKRFSEEAINFQEKLLVRNGLGPKTAFPDAMFRASEIGKTGKPEVALNMASARQEAEEVMFSSVADLLRNNNISPKEIDILIVNCSLFNPTPSLSAMIVNHFGMRHDVLTYNLSGMGCSAGLISIDLAKDLLQVHRNSTCIVVSTENITQNWYLGKEKSMLLTNTLFRMGGAAVLLSNKRRMRSRARYQLLHTVRTHRGADDPAYLSVYQVEDEDGVKGVRLSKSIMDVSGAALRQNITTLGPLVLSLDEQAKFIINFFRRWVT